MAQIARGQTSEAVTPWIDVYTSLGSAPLNPAVLEFAVDDVSTAELQAAPVQVFPVAGWHTVDVAGADKIADGRFVAEWTPDLAEALGRHRIRWRAKVDAGESDFEEWSETFEVVATAGLPYASGLTYTTVARMRAEGLPVGRADDARVLDLIEEMSREIDIVCGWWFSPRERTLYIDGRGTRSVDLPAPPIRIDEVALEDLSGNLVEETGAIPYGTAPVEGVEKPVSFLRRGEGAKWPTGSRNIVVRGLFGYTDPSGTAFGRTPFGIRRICEMMVLRGARPLDADADERWRGRVLSERTNRQAITFSELPERATAWDADPEISRLLARYRRPTKVRGA